MPSLPYLCEIMVTIVIKDVIKFLYASLLLFSEFGEGTIAPCEVNYTVSDISLRTDRSSVL